MIPLFRPLIPKPESWLPYYNRALRSGQLTNFGWNHDVITKRLDADFPGYHLPVANGTIALEVALLTASSPSKPIRNVAIPDFTFAATANAVIRAGMRPVIFPSLYENRLMDLKSLKSGRGHYDAILLVVPFGYGVPAAYAYELREFVQDERIPLICDLAGAWPMRFPISAGELCCYSLHAAKSLPIGEGGLICFPMPEQRDRARRLINFDFDATKEAQSPAGLNGKLDEVHCAILNAQLDMHEQVLARISARRDLIQRYESALGELCDPLGDPGGYPSLCVLRGLPASRIESSGAARGITFRRYYYPLLSDQRGFGALVKAGASGKGIDSYLAFPSDVTHDEFDQVVDLVRKVCRPA